MKVILLTLFLVSTVYANEKTICGETDDRVLSNEKQIGRASKRLGNIGCTATLIGKSCAISAGHCLESISKVSFNVPESMNKIPMPAEKEDIYYLDKSFLASSQNGEGDDWVVFKLNANKKTSLYPGDVQGYLQVNLSPNLKKGARVRITGYGEDANDPIRNFAQQTHFGVVKKIGGLFSSRSRLGYNVDTMGGNSGSSIILENTNEIIGVHSHGTCGIWGDYNEGTLIAKNKKFKQAIIDCLKSESK